jgi:tRNA (guanine37-N1)-methyltransferase
MKFKEVLKDKLTKQELSKLTRSFDVIGDIAIIEIPPVLKKKQAVIGKALLSALKNVKVIAAEEGEYSGKYRRPKLRIIAGEKRFETLHKESGILLKLNVSTCYYSPRLGSERLRIAAQVKKGERILVAGSGVAPYPLILAKYSPAKEIFGAEINPEAHKYAQQNIILNKMQNKIKLIKGDISKQKGTFDRIISAIPHLGIKLVPTLLKFAKKGTTLHVYDFAPEEDLEEPARKLKNIKILQVVKTQQVGIRRYRICIDAQPNIFK